ncbi:MAG: ArsR family transcriptional regulator [Halobacterium sp.]
MTDEQDRAPDSDYAPDEQILPGWPSEPEPEADLGGGESAFALVGNEIRAEIVKTLGDARGTSGSRPILSFSELHDRVDVDVVSSQFNYHLQQLVGNFVDRTEDGYRLHPVGSTLYRTIRAGTFTGAASFGPVDVGFDCYHCGTRAEGVYDEGMFTVQCRGCETLYDLLLVPPETLDPDDEADLLARLDQFGRHDRLAFSRGVCPVCVNGLDREFMEGDESPFAAFNDHDVVVHHACAHCGKQSHVTVGEALLWDPGLQSFHWERGVDLTATPTWHLEWAMTDEHTTVRSRDPWRVAVAVEADDDVLELVVDGDLEVLERNRR